MRYWTQCACHPASCPIDRPKISFCVVARVPSQHRQGPIGEEGDVRFSTWQETFAEAPPGSTFRIDKLVVWSGECVNDLQVRGAAAACRQYRALPPEHGGS